MHDILETIAQRQLREQQEKQKAEASANWDYTNRPHPVDTCNAACADASAPSYPQQQAGIYGCEARAVRPATRAESTINRLDEKVYRAAVDSEKAARIRDILTRHPEFFEFLEVFESGLV